ncbi:hypothetical protein Sa4125_25200 [Aureimonas sp. SA4125]|uniref:hypothetical protein n=1 Tax=Aureimonas sp. SA4125 TaxID=2826993 RepID=UPI001CC3FEE4|nr:hypothetical protein [Aureimonas sp. SA4125]BDA84978.1 hypothetical protein Sa4125_25200 [Aureimonas sp. SA4125]
MSETPNIVVIGGQPVDVSDPCARYLALYAYRMRLATGGAVEEIEIRSPLTTRRTKFSAGSKPADLDDLLDEAKAECEALTNGGVKRRTRFAIAARSRPY